MGELSWENPNKIQPRRDYLTKERDKRSVVVGNPEVLTGGLTPESADLSLARDIILSQLEMLAGQETEKVAGIRSTMANLKKEGGMDFLQSLNDELIEEKGANVTPKDVADKYIADYYQKIRVLRPRENN